MGSGEETLKMITYQNHSSRGLVLKNNGNILSHTSAGVFSSSGFSHKLCFVTALQQYVLPSGLLCSVHFDLLPSAPWLFSSMSCGPEDITASVKKKKKHIIIGLKQEGKDSPQATGFLPYIIGLLNRYATSRHEAWALHSLLMQLIISDIFWVFKKLYSRTLLLCHLRTTLTIIIYFIIFYYYSQLPTVTPECIFLFLILLVTGEPMQGGMGNPGGGILKLPGGGPMQLPGIMGGGMAGGKPAGGTGPENVPGAAGWLS